MEFPPAHWAVFPAEDFETACPRLPGTLGVELMAQVRPNGRVMDHWRLAIGGSSNLTITLDLAYLIPAAADQHK